VNVRSGENEFCWGKKLNIDVGSHGGQVVYSPDFHPGSPGSTSARGNQRKKSKPRSGPLMITHRKAYFKMLINCEKLNMKITEIDDMMVLLYLYHLICP